MPLGPSAELPTRADATSIAYRRWLRDKGLRFGTFREAAPWEAAPWEAAPS